mmetsp:Transcript_30462/g.94560  ORF Transcript_30462/g.94560 Transcript_30462/m.94560 type:complete len:700 (-) Transcript_30462:1318-3417(-)
MADAAISVPLSLAHPALRCVHVRDVVHLSIQDGVVHLVVVTLLQQGRVLGGARRTALDSGAGSGACQEHAVCLALELDLCLVVLVLRDDHCIGDVLSLGDPCGGWRKVLVVHCEDDRQIARLAAGVCARRSKCCLLLLEPLRHQDVFHLLRLGLRNLPLRAELVHGLLLLPRQHRKGGTPSLAIRAQCRRGEVAALVGEALQERGVPLLLRDVQEGGRVQLRIRCVDQTSCRRGGKPMVHGGVGHGLVLLPHPLSESRRGGVLVPERALCRRALAKDLDSAWRCTNEEGDVAHKPVDTLVEEIVATCILPAAPVRRDADLGGQLHLVGDLEVHVLAALDDGVQVARSASLHTHAVVVERPMRHVGGEPRRHEVVPVGRGINQRFLALAVDVGVDHVRETVVDAHDHARVKRSILQVEPQVLWRVGAEVNVVAVAKVPESVEGLHPLPRPHHGRPGQDVHCASLRRKLVVDLHGHRRVAPVKVIPVHDLDQQVPVQAAGAGEGAPLRRLAAALPPDAGRGVHRALGGLDPGGVDVRPKFAGVHTAEASRVLRLRLRGAALGRVPMLRQDAIIGPHITSPVPPAMVERVQADEAAILPDGHDARPGHERHDVRARNPMPTVHEQDVATRGQTVTLHARVLANVLQAAPGAVGYALREGDGVAKTVIAGRERDQVLHGVKAHGVRIPHLVVELLGPWDEGAR